jgi:hypothetical protein
MWVRRDDLGKRGEDDLAVDAGLAAQRLLGSITPDVLFIMNGFGSDTHGY